MTTLNCTITNCTREVAGIAYNGNAYCEVCMPSIPTIRYQTAEGCERCTTDAYVPHYSCLYGGKAVGHSAAHCTANACY